MFTTPHFIWLAISVVIIVGMFLIKNKFNLSFNAILNIMLVMSIASEVTKILCNMMDAPDGERVKF